MNMAKQTKENEIMGKEIILSGAPVSQLPYQPLPKHPSGRTMKAKVPSKQTGADPLPDDDLEVDEADQKIADAQKRRGKYYANPEVGGPMVSHSEQSTHISGSEMVRAGATLRRRATRTPTKLQPDENWQVDGEVIRHLGGPAFDMEFEEGELSEFEDCDLSEEDEGAVGPSSTRPASTEPDPEPVNPAPMSRPSSLYKRKTIPAEQTRSQTGVEVMFTIREARSLERILERSETPARIDKGKAKAVEVEEPVKIDKGKGKAVEVEEPVKIDKGKGKAIEVEEPVKIDKGKRRATEEEVEDWESFDYGLH
ncbi:hypothetical protein P280DRAFT_152207 [Massarina eburnea CBS 473.64]|uniref:Uncharacterized protein n=1 Tax=Massarina eburnea CBS 473.64 TaxID=1395130 RepID=A0A6A6RR13_9PLEO|nr:hypothetical protein P280DRAFT_152207 [Massarina eburnea CBS 473.64]